MNIREAPFALRVTRRNEGLAGIVYRRSSGTNGQDHLHRIAALSPSAFSTGRLLLAKGNLAVNGSRKLAPGPFIPLDENWGSRFACYAIITSGLRYPEKMLKAAEHFVQADGSEATWWLGVLTRAENSRSVRALRILTEAVE
ncbi:MAG: hypothetical protein V3U24_03675 [Candidatus Neomarinimicrobiota bacterium]